MRHRRFAPKAHEFSADIYFLFVDLDELESVFDGRWLWSVERLNVVSFRRRDFLEPLEQPLHEAVRARVEKSIGFRPNGSIRLLAGPRTLGLSFNPVVFYYCFDGAGSAEQLVAIVAEITNTPWGERHAYVLDTRGAARRTELHRFEKEFHVSPFIDMDVDCAWRFNVPGDQLVIHMDDIQRGGAKSYIADGESLFDATLTLRRQELSSWNMARALLRHPCQVAGVTLRIYLHAARLWMQRSPFYTHPKKRRPLGAGSQEA